jgi:hypothetical protein
MGCTHVSKKDGLRHLFGKLATGPEFVASIVTDFSV